MPDRQSWEPRWVISCIAIGILSLGWLVIVVALAIRGQAPSDVAIGALVAIPTAILGVILKCVRGKNGD